MTVYVAQLYITADCYIFMTDIRLSPGMWTATPATPHKILDSGFCFTYDVYNLVGKKQYSDLPAPSISLSSRLSFIYGSALRKASSINVPNSNSGTKHNRYLQNEWSG